MRMIAATLMGYALVILLFGLTGCAKPQPYTCLNPTPDEFCANQAFYDEWKQYKALNDKYTAPKPTKEDSIKMQGMVADLNQQFPTPIPGCYWKWDEQKLRWHKFPLPPAKQ